MFVLWSQQLLNNFILLTRGSDLITSYHLVSVNNSSINYPYNNSSSSSEALNSALLYIYSTLQQFILVTRDSEFILNIRIFLPSFQPSHQRLWIISQLPLLIWLNKLSSSPEALNLSLFLSLYVSTIHFSHQRLWNYLSSSNNSLSNNSPEALNPAPLAITSLFHHFILLTRGSESTSLFIFHPPHKRLWIQPHLPSPLCFNISSSSPEALNQLPYLFFILLTRGSEISANNLIWKILIDYNHQQQIILISRDLTLKNINPNFFCFKHRNLVPSNVVNVVNLFSPTRANQPVLCLGFDT